METEKCYLCTIGLHMSLAANNTARFHGNAKMCTFSIVVEIKTFTNVSTPSAIQKT